MLNLLSCCQNVLNGFKYNGDLKCKSFDEIVPFVNKKFVWLAVLSKGVSSNRPFNSWCTLFWERVTLPRQRIFTAFSYVIFGNPESGKWFLRDEILTRWDCYKLGKLLGDPKNHIFVPSLDQIHYRRNLVWQYLIVCFLFAKIILLNEPWSSLKLNRFWFFFQKCLSREAKCLR